MLMTFGLVFITFQLVRLKEEFLQLRFCFKICNIILKSLKLKSQQEMLLINFASFLNHFLPDFLPILYYPSRQLHDKNP